MNLYAFIDNEPDIEAEDEQDTWWCDFCQEDIPIAVYFGEPLPTHCPICNHPFEPAEGVP